MLTTAAQLGSVDSYARMLKNMTRLERVAAGISEDPYETQRMGEVMANASVAAKAPVRRDPGEAPRSQVYNLRGEDERRAEEKARTQLTVFVDLQWEDN